jgi:hypothetical protein
VLLSSVRTIYNASDNNQAEWTVLRGDTYTYIGQTGYMNYNLCFRKQENVSINISLGALGTGLNYTPEEIFSLPAYIMQDFCIKFNIIPFK